MSLYDSLVPFSTSPSTMQVTTGTNKSLLLVGAFFHFSLNHTGYNWHQQVIMTHWCLFSLIPQPCWPQRAPTSLYGSLMPFFASPLTMQAITSTNKPLWLVDFFFCFSLNHAGHIRHQQVVTTRWLLFFVSTSTITTISLVVVIKYKF